MHRYRYLLALVLGLSSLAPHAAERVTYYHNDALGAPIIATEQEGRVLWRKSYAPYGQPIGQAAPNEPGYTGKFEEPGLGIQNFGARWYDPRIGRFLAIDPAGFDPQNPQSFNRYAYANNNPYGFVDPDGNFAFIPAIIWAAGTGITAYDTYQTYQTEGLPGAAKSLVVDGTVTALTGGAGKLAFKALKHADSVTDVAEETTTVIGRVKDLKNLGAGERSLLDRLPNLGNPKANWKQNSGVLREEMRRGLPLRDASPDDTSGQFLNAERNLLRDRGWTFDSKNNYWMPPPKP